MGDALTGRTVVEASPLISFLKVDRFDILEAVCQEIVCTDHVTQEILLFQQRDRLEALFRTERLREVHLSSPSHLVEFDRLREETPLGRGEVSSILYAYYNSCNLIITDKKGLREAKRRNLACITTQEAMFLAVQSGKLSLNEANTLLLEWKSLDEHPVTVSSFEELL